MEEPKSRSSFVGSKRKSLTLTNMFDDPEEAKVQKSKLSIKSYIECLEIEKEEWKQLLKKKKIQSRESEKKHKNEPATITRINVEEFLTEEDKHFLESKPNYLKMVESVKTFIDSLKYLNMYKLDLIDYHRKVFSELEFQKKNLVDEMCGSDLCDICNIKNCGQPDHEFDQDF